MRIRCPKCSSDYEVADEHGGRLAFCHQCDTEFVLPIPDPDRLIAWAESAPWRRLFRFIQHSAARGHSQDTVNALISIFERRRWNEEAREEYRTAAARGEAALSRRERVWARTEKHLHRRRTLEDLRTVDPYEFERLIAQSFVEQGYDARAVGGTGDAGIDVDIRTKEGERWGIAQCKRYDASNKVSAVQIRSFCGAFTLSGAKHGFFFTTGLLTRQARQTSSRFSWLTVYNGPQLVQYLETINAKSETL